MAHSPTVIRTRLQDDYIHHICGDAPLIVRTGVSSQEVTLLRFSVDVNFWLAGAARVSRSFRLSMRKYRSIPEPGEDLPTFPSLAVQDSYQRGDKSSRDYPRTKKETTAGKPSIIRASRQQILAAQQIELHA